MDVAVASLSNPQMGEIDVVRRRTPLDHMNEHGDNSPSQEDDLENADWSVPHTTDIKTDNSPASSPGVSESGLPADGGGSSSRASSMSGDGGGDSGSHASSIEASTSSYTNRRKRKSVPVKRPSSNDPEEDDESALNEEGTKKKLIQDIGGSIKKVYQMRWSEVENDNSSKGSHPTSIPVSVSISAIEKPTPSNDLNGQKDFATMNEARMRMQLINAQPRKFCPVCGDKANGLHYGIYSCEGCKNFFKRSVLVCQDRPYVCKFGNTCSVSITEVYGVKQKTSRCQACRYQACIDAGMYHSGVQRSRGGRHSYSPSKVPHRSSSMSNTRTTQNVSMTITNSSSPPSLTTTDPSTSKQSNPNQETGLTSKYPQIQTPDIATLLTAVASSNTSPVSNVNPSNGYSESHSKNSQIFSKHLQHISQRSLNIDEDCTSQDKSTTRGKQKLKVSNNGNHNSDNYCQVRDLSTQLKGSSSKEALDFKMFAENLIRKNMSSMNSTGADEDKHQNDTSNITLKSLLSNVNAQEIKFMERFQTENLNSEIEILKAKNRELQLSTAEKDKQLLLYQKQVDILKNTLSKADKINKEQARTIESLKQSLLKEMERYDDSEKRDPASSHHGSQIGLTIQKKKYSNYISEFGQDRFKEKQRYPYKQERHSKGSEEDTRDNNFAIYERGGVTITPVNCSGSNNKNPNGNYELKVENEYEENGDRYNEDLATIEPVIEMNCSDEEIASSGDERILGDRSPDENTKEDYVKKHEHDIVA